jgi:hypothetical protein
MCEAMAFDGVAFEPVYKPDSVWAEAQDDHLSRP